MLAQYDTPDEILAHPADDFVARFVGQDRGLKRLSLKRLADVELAPARTAPSGRSADDEHDPPRRALADAERGLAGAARRRSERGAARQSSRSDRLTELLS